MTAEDLGPDEDGLSRRRFVKVCVAVATAAAVGSTVSSLLGIRSPVDVPLPPSATEAVAICPVCSVGCGLVSVASGGEAFPPRGDGRSSSTSGMVCTRGAFPPGTSWPSTIGTPLKRRSPGTRGMEPKMDQFEPWTWEQALDDVSRVLLENGMVDPTARGCILGSDLAFEDAYVAGKLFKGALRSSSIDTVESLHSRASDRVMMDQLGEVASPTCLNDIGLASMLLVIGEDIATTHPVVYARVAEAVTGKGTTLVVMDPRMTATATRTKSVHVPVRAGGEVALLNAIAHVLRFELEVAPSQWALDNSLNARAFAEYTRLYSPEYDESVRVDPQLLVDLCDGPSTWVSELGNRDSEGLLKPFDVATITGIEAGTVRELARKWNLSRNVLTLWSSRLGGAGDDGAAISSALNLHLLTGKVGRPGSGCLGLQATASGRGAMESGASPLTLPGSQPAGGSPSPALVEAWGTDLATNAANLLVGPGVVDILSRAKLGDLNVLVLLGGNVTSQLPDRENLVVPALTNLSYVVATAAHLEDPDVAWADLVLPRPSWYEREAHYVSSERKVGRSLPSLAPLDGAWTEMRFLAALGSRFLGGNEFDFPTSTVAMEEMSRASSGAPSDMTALPLGRDLTDARGVQWPVPDPLTAASKGTPRRHMGQDGRTGFPTTTGKALALPREHPGLKRPPNASFPMTALVSLDAATWWDGQQYGVLGGEVVRRRRVEPAYVEVSPEDATELGLAEGSRALVTSATSSMELPVRLGVPGMAKGHVFIPWGVDEDVQRLAPSFPLDGDGIPPWSHFPVRVEAAPL